MESEIRFKFQGELLDNIRQNVKSGLYNFTGGKKQFEEWEKRAANSSNNGERQALLIEADRLMVEVMKRKAKVEDSSTPKKRSWKFW